MPAVTPAPPAPDPTLPPNTPDVAAQQQKSPYALTREAVQAALDRGELSQALLLLSDWYGDPSLTIQETQELSVLLSQLAGTVIYSTESLLEPPYVVQPGETLQDIAQRYSVPWQLLARINGVAEPQALQPGQSLKVVRGPFSAMIDLSERRLTLMLDRHYAGQFPVEVDPANTIEEGHWSISQKLLTPGDVPMVGSSARSSSEQYSIMLANAAGMGQPAVLRSGNSPAAAGEPVGRVLRLNTTDVQDIYGILSLGSSVTIRR